MKPVKEKKSNITEEMHESMKKIWDVFDTGESGKVPMIYLNKILRALDIGLEVEELVLVQK